MTERTCTQCPTPLTGRQQRYCSPLCASRGFAAARSADGRLRDYRRRITATGRAAEYQRQRREGLTGLALVPCAACGGPTGRVAASEPDRERACSNLCRSYLRNGAWPSSTVRVAKPPRDQRRPLRKAWELRDWDAVQRLLLERTERTPSGCDQWTGRESPDGYAIAKIGHKNFSAHRMMGMAISRAALGSLTVHHICTNRACIRPTHLRLVPAADNIAEMLHRNWYVARIAELETALAAADPGNPALAVLPFVI